MKNTRLFIKLLTFGPCAAKKEGSVELSGWKTLFLVLKEVGSPIKPGRIINGA